MPEPNALFLPQCQSAKGSVEIYHEPSVFRFILEYIYTDAVESLRKISVEGVVKLLVAADEFLLFDLKDMCEHAAAALLDPENFARLLLVARTYKAKTLTVACLEYLKENQAAVTNEKTFREEIRQSSQLALLVVDALQGSQNPLKRQRAGDASDDGDDDDNDGDGISRRPPTGREASSSSDVLGVSGGNVVGDASPQAQITAAAAGTVAAAPTHDSSADLVASTPLAGFVQPAAGASSNPRSIATDASEY